MVDGKESIWITKSIEITSDEEKDTTKYTRNEAENLVKKRRKLKKE